MLKLIQVQKAAGKKSHGESVRQRLLHTQSYWCCLKMSPGGRLPGAASTKGEGAQRVPCTLLLLCTLLPPPLSGRVDSHSRKPGWAHQRLGWSRPYPQPASPLTPAKRRAFLWMSAVGCLSFFTSSETPPDFFGVRNLEPGQPQSSALVIQTWQNAPSQHNDHTGLW